MLHYGMTWSAGAGAGTQVDALTLKLQEIGFDDAEPPDMMDDDDRAAIKVRTLTGREIVVDIDPADTVERIKQRVEEMEGIPPEQQRLILGGRQLADGRTARECNVGAGCIIHLVLALRGGG